MIVSRKQKIATLELLLVFIPGLIRFSDRYLKLLLLSYIPSANTLLTLLFSEALSTNFFSILPSCTSSLDTSKDRILFFLISTVMCIFRYPFLFDINCYVYFQISFSNMPFVTHPLSSISHLNTSAIQSNEC
jgi:hypothetical protein